MKHQPNGPSSMYLFHNSTHVLKSGLVHQEHGITSTVTQKGDLYVKHLKVSYFVFTYNSILEPH